MKSQIFKVVSCFIVLILSGFHLELLATHIVGGQMSFTCLGNNKYAITLLVQRDCLNGADTVYFDNPAEIGVYNAFDKSVAWRVGTNGKFDLEFFNDDTINETINSGCIAPGQKVCVHQSVYRKIITLPFSEQGYIIAYQRCCRNTTLTNVLDPLETGTTFAITISALDMQWCNSSPEFGAFPPTYTCQDKPFIFDHSAVDINGDSLVYSLCLPNTGRTRLDPKGFPTAPPYDSVILRSAYSLNNLLNPNNTGIPLKIDSKTGLLTGTPNTMGQFLVGVCVTEYRNGVKLGYSKREFEINVVPCGIQPIADFEISTGLCNGLKQNFTDKSKNAITYQWFFDYPNNLNLFSTDSNPSFTFPKDGNYSILLIVKNGSCIDSIQKTIKVLDPELFADFNLAALCDSPRTISTVNNSTSKFGISDYKWTLTGPNISLTSSQKNPIFNIAGDGIYKCTLIITDVNGCKDTLTKEIETKEINFELIEDRIICSGDTVHLVKKSDSNYNYKWSPLTGLDLTNINDPIAKPTITTTYMVTVTNGACKLEKKVTIFVKSQITFQIMGDSVTCDGLFNMMASSDSTNLFEWADNLKFDPIISKGPKFNQILKKNITIYVKAGTSDQCSEPRKINLKYNGLDLKYNKLSDWCQSDSVEYNITNLDSLHKTFIIWKPDSLVINGQGTFKPKFKLNRPGFTRIYFMASNEFGCQLSDSIEFNIKPNIQPDMKVEYECGSRSIKVTTNYLGRVKWDFGDGIGSSNKTVDNYTYTKDGIYIVTIYADTTCAVSNSQTITLTTNTVNLKDTLQLCPGDQAILNPNPDLKFKYKWSPDTCFINPYEPNPIPKANKDMKYFVEYYDPNNPNCIFKDSICVAFIRGFYLDLLEKDKIICDSTNITLQVHSNMDLTWCDRNGITIGTGDSLKIIISRDSFIIVKGNFRNCVDRDTIRINFIEFNSEIIGPGVICPKDTIVLKVNPIDTNWSYEWSPPENIVGSKFLDSATVVLEKNTLINLKIVDGNGCERILKHQVDVSGIGGIIFAKAEPDLVTAGEKVQLTTVFNRTYSYKWEPNDGSLSSDTVYNPIAMPLKTTTYTVTVTDENGCTSTANVIVKVIPCDEAVFIPNAFSPNGDLKNDIFRPRGSSLTKVDMIIYNRWGQEIFHTNKIGEGWDGYFKGDKLEPDVFAYYLKFQCLDNQEFSKKGNISLLK